MSAKTSAEVLIGGKIYTLSGYESEEYLQKVASYINNKVNEYNKLEAFRLAVSDWAEGRIQTIYSNDKYLELFRLDAGKGNALRFVCEYLGVPLSDAYAAGDAENDISMLQAAGCGIAMRNAPDPVKEAADVVTRSDNDQDGLAETMRRLL